MTADKRRKRYWTIDYTNGGWTWKVFHNERVAGWVIDKTGTKYDSREDAQVGLELACEAHGWTPIDFFG